MPRLRSLRVAVAVTVNVKSDVVDAVTSEPGQLSRCQAPGSIGVACPRRKCGVRRHPTNRNRKGLRAVLISERRPNIKRHRLDSGTVAAKRVVAAAPGQRIGRIAADEGIIRVGANQGRAGVIITSATASDGVSAIAAIVDVHDLRRQSAGAVGYGDGKLVRT